MLYCRNLPLPEIEVIAHSHFISHKWTSQLSTSPFGMHLQRLRDAVETMTKSNPKRIFFVLDMVNVDMRRGYKLHPLELPLINKLRNRVGLPAMAPQDH